MNLIRSKPFWLNLQFQETTCANFTKHCAVCVFVCLFVAVLENIAGFLNTNWWLKGMDYRLLEGLSKLGSCVGAETFQLECVEEVRGGGEGRN